MAVEFFSPGSGDGKPGCGGLSVSDLRGFDQTERVTMIEVELKRRMFDVEDG
jgi:hypothetical protein